MIDRSCQDCLYADICARDFPCEYYDPISEQEYFDHLLENDRAAYDLEWSKYTDEDIDPLIIFSPYKSIK